MTAKRNADANVNDNLNIKLKHLLVSGYKRDIRTEVRTDVTSRRNAICPLLPSAGGGVKKL